MLGSSGTPSTSSLRFQREHGTSRASLSQGRLRDGATHGYGRESAQEVLWRAPVPGGRGKSSPEGFPCGKSSATQGQADSQALREVLDPDPNG